MSDGDRFTYSGNFVNSQFGGDGSTFEQNIGGGHNTAAGADPQRIGPLIDELLRLVAEHSGSVDHPERARRDAEEILNEVARPEEERDSGRIADAFRRLRARLEPIAAFAQTLGGLAEALRAIIPG